MANIYAFDLPDSYFNEFSFSGNGNTEGESAITHNSTLSNENEGDSFYQEVHGQTQSVWTAQLMLERTGFTQEEGTTVSFAGDFAGTTEYEGGELTDTASGEDSDSYELGYTIRQYTDGNTAHFFAADHNGVIADFSFEVEGSPLILSEFVEKKATAVGLVAGDTYESWTSKEVPVTVVSTTWFTSLNDAGLMILTSDTTQGLHDVVSWFTVEGILLVEATQEFALTEISYSTDDENKKGFFEGRRIGNYLKTANALLGVNGERGLWVLHPREIPDDMDAAIAALGEWDWSEQELAGVKEQEDGATWAADGMRVRSMKQVSVWTDTPTVLFTLELRPDITIRFNYVENGELLESSSVIHGSTFETTMFEREDYSTERVTYMARETCFGVFLIGDGFTQETVQGTTIRDLLSTSAETVKIAETAFGVGVESSSSVFVQGIDGAVYDNATSYSQQVGGQRNDKQWTELVGYGFQTQGVRQPVAYIKHGARGYVPFYVENTQNMMLFKEAGGAILSTTGEQTVTFGTHQLAPCSDMLGEEGRSRLDSPCNCTTDTITRFNTDETVTIPKWEGKTYSTTHEVWDVVDGEITKSEESLILTSYEEGTTTAHPVETFSISRRWISDAVSSEDSRRFRYTLRGPDLLTVQGTVEVSLGGGRVNANEPFWRSYQPADSVIFAGGKEGFLWWAGLCLDLAIIDKDGNPSEAHLPHGDDDAATYDIQDKAVRWKTSPMLVAVPGASPIFYPVLAAVDAGFWPALSIEG